MEVSVTCSFVLLIKEITKEMISQLLVQFQIKQTVALIRAHQKGRMLCCSFKLLVSV